MAAIKTGIREDYDRFARELKQIGTDVQSKNNLKLERVQPTVYRLTLRRL